MNQIELKPCPFCGGTAEEIGLLKNNVIVRYGVQCACCGASTEPARLEKEAAEAWNNRANE